MIKKINIIHLVIIFSVMLLLVSSQRSYADGDTFTVNIPNAEGAYTAIVIRQSGSGYLGPNGEYYPQFPSVTQLQQNYGSGQPNTTMGADSDDDSDSTMITVEPPALPDEDQPPAPSPDYNWTPGYWSYDSFNSNYYWVPGSWVMAPNPGYVWTPGYWYWRDGRYAFSQGYWGTHVGFYGGVDYGYGYHGEGYARGDHRHRDRNAGSFNGGPHGTKNRPTHDDQIAMREKHIPFTIQQKEHVQAARTNPAFKVSANHKQPMMNHVPQENASTQRQGAFKGNILVSEKRPIVPGVSFKSPSVRSPSQEHHVTNPQEKNPVMKKPVAEKKMIEKSKAAETTPVQNTAPSNNKNSQGSN